MLPFRVVPKALAMQSAVQSTGVDWYVDSVGGNDANSGKSKSAPFQTINALLGVMAAGETAGLARGSHWREELVLPGDNSKARAYGSGARPILDASNVVAGGSWSKTGGQTNVYETSVTPEWGLSVDYLNVWEDDVFLTRAANLGACDSTPGSCFPSAGSGTTTFYIHPNGSTNPTSDGKTYEYSHRQTGLDCFNYSGCIVSGIETRKQLVTNGSLVLGRFSTAIDCLAKWGNSHNIFLKGGAMVISCIAEEAYYSVQDPFLFVAYESDPSNLDLFFIDCIARNAAYNPDVNGFAAHTDGVNAFGTLIYDGCAAVNCFNGFTGDDCAAIIATDIACTDCSKPVITSNASPWTIDGLTVTGAITRVIEMQPAATVITANNVDVDADVTDGRMFYMTTGSTLTLTNSNIRGTSFSGTSRIFYISQAGATLICDGNIYGDGFAHVYYLPNIGSFTSDNNCFDDNTENFKINAPSYATVAAYQAGESQDLNSTIGGCAA